MTTQPLFSVEPKLHVFAVRLGPPLSELEFSLYLQQLSNEDQQRILKFLRWEDRQRALFANQLLHWGIQQLVTGDQPFQILRDEQGRPFLNTSVRWEGDFNLSHSGEWVVLAFVNRGKIGIDVERIERIDLSIYKEALTCTERTMLSKAKLEDRLKLFYELWTMKESIWKTGWDPHLSLDTVDVIKLAEKKCIPERKTHLKLSYLDQDHPVSVCWNHNRFPDEIVVLERGHFHRSLLF